MKLTQFENSAMQSLMAHATETQTICKGLGHMLTSDELRANIRRANVMYDLRPAILERIAKQVESTIGVSMRLNQT